VADASIPQAGYGSSPPGGMGITSQGFGQEGYILDSSDVGPRPQPPPELENFVVGVPYFLPFATPYRDAWEVFRDDPVSIRQLTAMRRQDGQARGLYRLMTMPILAALKESKIIPIEDTDGGEAEAKFCHDMLFLPPSAGGMTHPLYRFIKQMMLALFNGFTAWELVYWSPEHGPLKGKWTIRKIDWRPSETLTFLLDGQGEFNGFRQRTFFQGRTIDVKIPKDTAIYYANEEAERPFYGVSMFESAFYHYDKKTKVYYIMHLAAQRAATGLRVGTMPPNPPAADKNNFIRGLANLGLAQYMVAPSADWTVTNIKEEGNFDFLGLVNHHNSQMSKSVLAEWFDEQQGGGQGDTELVDFGKQSDASYMMMLEAILQEMASVITDRILPRFVDWNFGSGKYPRWVWGTLTSEQKAAIQDTFDKLAAAPQANVSPEFMIQLEKKMAVDLGLVVDYGPIEEREKENTDLQDQAKKVAFNQQIHPELAMQGQPGAPGGAGQTAGQGGAPSGGGATGATGPPLGDLPGGTVQPLPSNNNPFSGGSSSSSPPGGGPGTPYGRLSSTAASLLHELIELSRLEAANEHGATGAPPGSGSEVGAAELRDEAGDSDPGEPV
jgi:hypothetical protein